jgi:hypothetical protein
MTGAAANIRQGDNFLSRIVMLVAEACCLPARRAMNVDPTVLLT